MRPMEFYRLAVAIAPNAVSEPFQRTVVGRLYYGLHHEACCRYYRVNSGADPLDRFNRHATLQRRFNQQPDATSKKVANLLQRLRQFRTQVDYELGQMHINGRPVTAEQMLNSATRVAQQLLEALESYSPGEAPDGCVCKVS